MLPFVLVEKQEMTSTIDKISPDPFGSEAPHATRARTVLGAKNAALVPPESVSVAGRAVDPTAITTTREVTAIPASLDYGQSPRASSSSCSDCTITLTSGDEVTVVDRNGFIVARVSAAHRIFDAHASNWRMLPLGAQVRTAVKHLLCYGQSLGRGQNSSPVLSTIQPYRNIMLRSGVKVRAGDATINGRPKTATKIQNYLKNQRT